MSFPPPHLPSAPFSTQRRIGKALRTRYADIASWLQLDKDTVAEWHALSWDFSTWVFDGIASGSIDKEEVASVFPVVWARFVSESGRSDHIVPKFTMEEGL